MIRPLENQERLSSTEYVNRVKQTDHGHGAAPRDFAFAIEELSREGHKERRPSPEFGEDTYEPSKEEEERSETAAHPSQPTSEPPSEDEGNLDIVV